MNGYNFYMYYRLTLLVYDDQGVVVFVSTLESFTGSGSPQGFQGDGVCMILLPSGAWSPGCETTVALAGTAYCEHALSTEPARVSLDWDIESVTLWEGSPSLLERNAWASVKSSFQGADSAGVCSCAD